MPLVEPSDAAWQATLLAKLGDTPDRALEGLLAALWAQYPQYTGYRRALAVTADALTLLIGEILKQLCDPAITEAQVNAARVSLQIRQAQQSTLAAELAGLLTSSSPPVVAGRLTTSAPLSGRTGEPDPNATRYSGDPTCSTYGRGY